MTPSPCNLLIILINIRMINGQSGGDPGGSFDAGVGSGGSAFRANRPAPAPSFAKPSSNYGAPSPSYAGPSPSYGGPAPSYAGPSPSYGAPSPSYAGPSPSYPGPSPSYAGSSPSYAAPSPSYAGPSPSYAGPSPSYSGPSPGPSPGSYGPSPTYIPSGPSPSYSGPSGTYAPSPSPSYGPSPKPGPVSSGYAPGPVGPTYSGPSPPTYSGPSSPAVYGQPGGSYVPSGTYGSSGGTYGSGGYGPVGPSGGGCGCGGGGGGGYGGPTIGGCGTCGDTSDPCYRKHTNCIIVNAQPYERRSQISLDTCKTYCRNSTSTQYQCRSFVYDNINQICDLFAHVGNQPPAKLVQYQGRDYYEVTGATNCTSTPGPSPSAACTSGQTARYITVPDYKSINSGGTSSPGTSLQTCIDACNKGQTSDGKTITCKSFDFGNGQCTFYTSATTPAGQGAGLQQSPGTTHVDQICVDSGQTCVGPSERDPQKILIGFAEMVTDATDFNDCYQKCINAQTTFNVNCKSGMFYYQERSNNCILNTETKGTHPDLFNNENQDTVDYFEPNCGGGSTTTTTTTSGGRRLSLLRGFLSKKNSLAANSDDSDVRSDDESVNSVSLLNEWTQWSHCDRRKDGRRIRYRVCTKSSLKQCPFESEWCNIDTLSRRLAQSSSPLFGLTSFTLRNITETNDPPSVDINCPVDICCPVFGGCRVGLRRSSGTGQVHWCSNPCLN